MSTLHVLNGDCAVDVLSRSGVAGDVCVYSDILHDGPVRGIDGDSFIAERAEFIVAAGIDSFDAARQRYVAWDAALGRHGEYDEVVIWVEHDLFDQLLLPARRERRCRPLDRWRAPDR